MTHVRTGIWETLLISSQTRPSLLYVGKSQHSERIDATAILAMQLWSAHPMLSSRSRWSGSCGRSHHGQPGPSRVRKTLIAADHGRGILMHLPLTGLNRREGLRGFPSTCSKGATCSTCLGVVAAAPCPHSPGTGSNCGTLKHVSGQGSPAEAALRVAGATNFPQWCRIASSRPHSSWRLYDGILGVASSMTVLSFRVMV